MLSSLVCGFNLNHEEEDGACQSSSTSTPKKHSKRRDNNRDKNPYSTRGLDKFSELLAELDERRKKVYSKMNPHDISFVRFAYSDNDDFVPIVVKVKNKDQNHKKNSKRDDQEDEKLKVRVRHMTSFSEPMQKTSITKEKESKQQQQQQPKLLESDNRSLLFSLDRMKYPSFYVPAVMILILVFLTVFGRSVATLCTCVLWYVIPVLSDTSFSSFSSSSSSKPIRKTVRNTNKKEYVRELSEKKMVVKDNDSPKHGHQNSW
ncbi:hypothetical protein HN51_053032 [Arachis hypogaea]|uniref:ZCF37 n=1 Tax=Arachis hypogaea TaxID=3818 RepID=A0A445C8L8_ARAHY|nr:uncharacterized protein LOC107606359 [Arachis ipaensis]XP_025665315.1 uncharacterized protein LOC112764010 [Arachis hypogaea]QHN94456.1 uncharacterized protein DS421_17g601400 [Arachis hypogaea]RYR47191.1 hypothetical protein Ahy_A07g033142 [Arachis hypogaea]